MDGSRGVLSGLQDRQKRVLLDLAWMDAAVLSLILEARSSASFAEVDTMSVQGLDAPHVLPVFCCVQSSSDETRAAVVKNLGVGGDLELRMLEIVRLG
jgi:hypothetical protein